MKWPDLAVEQTREERNLLTNHNNNETRVIYPLRLFAMLELGSDKVKHHSARAQPEIGIAELFS